MAEYFYDKQSARDFIKKSTQGRPALFARIRLHGNEAWIVDYQRRDFTGNTSMQVLDNLNHEVDDIMKG